MAYLIILPLFVFVYQAIVCAEEAFLLETFGSDYAQYCATVPRVLPTVRGLRRSFVGITYDWRRAVRKDLSTIAGILIGLILFPVWRTYFLEGFEAAKAKTPTALGLVLTVLVLYGLLHHVKKHTRLLYLPPTP